MLWFDSVGGLGSALRNEEFDEILKPL